MSSLTLDKPAEVQKNLRKEERISIAPVSVLFTSIAGQHSNPHQVKIIKGEERDQLNELHATFQSTLQSQHARIVNVNILTEGGRGDIGNDIIGATYLLALRNDNRFGDCNLCVQVLENPYPVNDTSRVPNDTARNIWEGALSYLCSQNNMLGLCGTRAILSVSLTVNADGGEEQFVLSTSATPGSLQYEKKVDRFGNRLLGRDLTNTVMAKYNGQLAHVMVNCYGLTQRPDTLDKDGMLQNRLPNISVGHYDRVQVDTSTNYGIIPDDYHGILMGLAILSDQSRRQYGLVQDGSLWVFNQSSAMYKCATEAVSQIEIPQKYSLRIGFLSTSVKKVREVMKMMKSNLAYINEKQFNGGLSKFNIETYRIQFKDMPEKQSMDPVDVIESKVDDLRFKLDQLSSLLGLDIVFNDDTSFEITALNREPSTLYRTMYDKMLNMERNTTHGKYAYDAGDVAVGYNYNNYACDKVTAEISKNPSLTRECYAITIFGAHITTGYGTIIDTILMGRVRGVVPNNPSGNREFGWDTIFDFETYIDEYGTTYHSGGRTYASMTDDELASVKPRAIAIRKALVEKLFYVIGNTVGTETYLAQTAETQTHVKEKALAKVNVFTDLFSSGQIAVAPTQQGTKVSSSSVVAQGSNMAALMAAFS